MITTLFSDPLMFFISLTAIVLAITIHEFAHAYVADHLGDPTPRLQGRVSLNPVKHIDPMGMLLIVMFGFGWGRAVEFDPYNLKHPLRDTAKIALAGPLINFILAVICAVLLRFILPSGNEGSASLMMVVISFFYTFISFNVILGIFNLIPLHPLDGYKIVAGLLPQHKLDEWADLRRYGPMLLIIMILPLVNGRSMIDVIMKPILSFIFPLLIPPFE